MDTFVVVGVWEDRTRQVVLADTPYEVAESVTRFIKRLNMRTVHVTRVDMGGRQLSDQMVGATYEGAIGG